MSGPWSGLFNFFGREVGSSLGKRLTKDLQAAERAFSKTWTHADKIKELKGDSELSPSYVKDLVEESMNNKEELSSIRAYLMDANKTSNLTTQARNGMLKRINIELERIHDSEILKQLIQAAKGKGVSSLDVIVEYISHLA